MKKRLAVYLTLVSCLALFVWGVAYLSSSEAQSVAPPPGSYTLTCTDITFTGTPGETPLTLSATCKTSSGGTKQTSLKYDIANCNGTLQWAPNGC